MNHPLPTIILTALLALVIGGCSASAPARAPAAPRTDRSSAAALGNSSRFLEENPDAKVEVVEFFDFQCPPCALTAPALERLADEFGADLTIAVRHFPLSMHANAMSAALASEAAAEQGQFPTMYSEIFRRQNEWAELDQDAATQYFRSVADDLALDVGWWDESITAPASFNAIDRDRALGLRLGIEGTPSIFVNGRAIAFSSYEELRSVVAQELARR